MRITHRANFTDADFALTTCLVSEEHFTLSDVSLYFGDATAAVRSCFPAAPGLSLLVHKPFWALYRASGPRLRSSTLSRFCPWSQWPPRA